MLTDFNSQNEKPIADHSYLRGMDSVDQIMAISLPLQSYSFTISLQTLILFVQRCFLESKYEDTII
jgi:hypothetical protein